MIAGNMKLLGEEEFRQLMKDLPERIYRKHMKAALERGGELLRQAVVNRAPVRTGLLRQSIKSKLAKRGLGVLVGTEAGDFQGETFYGAFLEYGYMKQETYRTDDGKIHSMKRGRGKPTAMPAQPFMRPAFEQSKATVARVVGEELRNRIEADAVKFASRQRSRLERDANKNAAAANALGKILESTT